MLLECVMLDEAMLLEHVVLVKAMVLELNKAMLVKYGARPGHATEALGAGRGHATGVHGTCLWF